MKVDTLRHLITLNQDMARELERLSAQEEQHINVKPKKQVKWVDLPMFIGVSSKSPANHFTYLGEDFSNTGMARLFNATSNTIGLQYSSLTLSPAFDQPWLFWQGGDCPIPEGVLVDIAHRDGNIKIIMNNYC